MNHFRYQSDEQYLDAIEDLEIRIRSLKRTAWLTVFLTVFLVGTLFIPFAPVQITSATLLTIFVVLFLSGAIITTIEFFDTTSEFRNPWNRLRVIRREYGRFVVKDELK